MQRGSCPIAAANHVLRFNPTPPSRTAASNQQHLCALRNRTSTPPPLHSSRLARRHDAVYALRRHQHAAPGACRPHAPHAAAADGPRLQDDPQENGRPGKTMCAVADTKHVLTVRQKEEQAGRNTPPAALTTRPLTNPRHSTHNLAASPHPEEDSSGADSSRRCPGCCHHRCRIQFGPQVGGGQDSPFDQDWQATIGALGHLESKQDASIVQRLDTRMRTNSRQDIRWRNMTSPLDWMHICTLS